MGPPLAPKRFELVSDDDKGDPSPSGTLHPGTAAACAARRGRQGVAAKAWFYCEGYGQPRAL